MNSLDLYDFTDPVIPEQSSAPSSVEGSSSSSLSTAMEETSQPSLNDEVTQVIHQLGRFWGGVRKQVRYEIDPLFSSNSIRSQSQTAFESARKVGGNLGHF